MRLLQFNLRLSPWTRLRLTPFTSGFRSTLWIIKLAAGILLACISLLTLISLLGWIVSVAVGIK